MHVAKYVIATNPLPTLCIPQYGVGYQLALFPPPSYILLMTLYNIVVTSKDCTKTLYIIISLLFIRGNTVTVNKKMCLSVEAKRYMYACWLPWPHYPRLHIINPA